MSNEKKMINKPIYILSMQASQIWEHMNRNREFEKDYCGMLPYSLELMQLRKQEGFTAFNKKRLKDRDITHDIINVEFDSGVKSGSALLKSLPNSIAEVEEKIALQLNIEDKEVEKYENGELIYEEGKLIYVKENDKDSKRMESLCNYKVKLESFLEEVKESVGADTKSDKWKGKTVNKLRKELYKNGFTLQFVNGKTGEIDKIEYVVYKRSSSKSRTGQCLMIRKELRDDMIRWSRMNLDFKEGERVDLAALLAYESLVGSALEDTIKINPDNILLVDDVVSTFTIEASVIRKDDETGNLNSFQEPVEISNSLWDGQSLLDEQYFKDKDYSFMLLRSHMFKSAAFRCDVQQFLKDNCPEGEVTDMFGNVMKIEDVHMITTPNSLKCLRFADVFVEDKELKQNEEAWKEFWKENKKEYQSKMLEYWKELVRDREDSIFGICKHEKESKRGKDGDIILNQMSYQMVNSMPLSSEQVSDIAQFEKDFISDLKEDNEKYVQYLENTATNMNSNMMMVALYRHNPEIVHTELFKDFRRAEINRYVTRMKQGKIRQKGDYMVLLGNPVEFLYKSIGKLNDDLTIDKDGVEVLKDNEIYTTAYDDGKELVGFRNPHTSPSNCLHSIVRENEEIKKYFSNLTKNIAVVNTIGFELPDKLNGSDFDSDSCLYLDSDTLLNVVKDHCSKYPVCINKISSDSTPYVLSNVDHCKIDNALSKSQDYIGRVVNLGQEVISVYWDKVCNGAKEEEIQDLIKLVEICSILSGVAIDMAKKTVDIDMEEEIKIIENSFELKTAEMPIYDDENKKKVDKNGEILTRKMYVKPQFFKFVSENENIGKKISYYDTPMDFLFKELSGLDKATGRGKKDLKGFLKEKDVIDPNKGNRHQKSSINSIITAMDKEVKHINASNKGKKAQEKRRRKAMNTHEEYCELIAKKKIKLTTMKSMILDYIDPDKEVSLVMLNKLYQAHPETFLAVFK